MIDLAPTQSNASLRFDCDLGPDALILLEVEVQEALSTPFEARLTCELTQEDADLSALVGADATVTLTGGDGAARLIRGVIWSLRRERRDCRIVLRPWLSLASLRGDNRVFQEKTTTDIATAVFDAAGFADYRLALTGSQSPRPYCVQFAESDFAFVSRLLEEEGLGYCFEHAADACTLVIFDDVGALTSLGAAPFLPLPDQGGQAQDLRVQRFGERLTVTSGKIVTRDFNYETPSETLEVSVGGGARGPYPYPGRYADSGAGETVAKRRLEALEAEARVMEGASPWRAFVPGALFDLTDHPDAALNATYLVRAVSHRAARGVYENRFEAQLQDDPWRPALVTPRPRIAGPQTAKVVGPAGDELWTDAYGRIKVQFHWDREGTNDENSSCWVRVAQIWAGAGWGAMALPRIGQEVVVSFLDGDPDRPLVIGSVYNADNPAPYALPAEQTKTTLKSDSSKDAEGFNELRFEDKAGEEEIFLHAQKDMNVTILNDRTTSVGHDETTTVKNARTVTIEEADEKLTVSKGARTVEVTEGDETHTVGGKRTYTVTGDETRTNEAKLTHDVTGDMTLTVKGALTIKVSGNVTIQTDGGMNLKSAGAFSISAGGAFSLSAGSSASIAAGTSVEMTGGTSFTVKGSASGTVDGGGMLTVKGGLVKIN